MTTGATGGAIARTAPPPDAARGPDRRSTDLVLLGVLALLWGSSYPLIKVAVSEIPPLTLVAFRVLVASAVLLVVVTARRARLPNDLASWRQLGCQAVLNSIGAWTVLAWGQKHVDSALAAVLNSTAPIFVFLITSAGAASDRPPRSALAGAGLGVAGVACIVGTPSIASDPLYLAGAAAVLFGAVLYAGAAIYGRRFAHQDALVTATGTMLWASACLVPAALLLERPWSLRPSIAAIAAATVLSVACTGLALVIYFRLLKRLGPLATSSQAYLRAGVGALIGVFVLGERLSAWTTAGVVLTVLGVVVINAPGLRSSRRGRSRAPELPGRGRGGRRSPLPRRRASVGGFRR